MQRILYVLLGVLLVPTVGLVGDVVTDGKFESTTPTGAPLQVASDDMVLNLNADMVDGLEASDFASASDTYTKAEVDALVASAVASATGKRFYITNADTTGDNALGLCASGFHMATFFEISEPSSLVYAFDAPNAWIRSDSGVGPPTSAEGWVRTGFLSGSYTEVGQANCVGWTSESGDDYGTVARLSSTWSDATGSGAYVAVLGTPWVAVADACSDFHRVWCVED